MVSQTEFLKAQQKQLKTSQRRTAALQVQQKALQTGRTTAEILAQMEEEKRAEEERKLREAAARLSVPVVVPIPTIQENIRVSYGGITVELTGEQYNEAIGMYKSYLRKGKVPSAYGRDPMALAYAGALISKASASPSALTYKPSAREMAIAESMAIYSSRPGTILATPSLTGTRTAPVGEQGMGITESGEVVKGTAIISGGRVVGIDTGTQTIAVIKGETKALPYGTQPSRLSWEAQAALPWETSRAITPTVSSETLRYQNVGYSKLDAEKLARESVKQGGMSFAPEAAKRIIQGETYRDIQRGGVARTPMNILGLISAKVEGLKEGEGLKGDGLSGVSGAPYSKDYIISDKQRSADTGLGWFDRLLRTVKKDVEKGLKGEETYNPITGMYEKSAEGVPVVSVSTLIQRPPSQKELEKIKHSEAIGGFAPLPEGIIPKTSFEKFLRGGIDIGLDISDFISVGGQTAKQLDKKQEKLNKEIEEFNKKYGDKELTEREYGESQNRMKELQTKQESIDEEKRKKISSFSYKLSAFTFGTFQRGALDPMIDVATGKPIKVYAGTIDITPVSSFSFLDKIDDIRFIGTQKVVKSGDIATDIFFATDKGRVGLASGITRTSADDILNTITTGKSGKIGVQFPSGKSMTKNIQSFIGRGISKQSQIGAKAMSTLETDTDALLKVTNLDDLSLTKTIGFTETIAAKGKKIMKTGIEFPTGRIVTRPASITKDLSKVESLALQEDDLVKIVGGAKSIRGGKTKFKGVIKILDTGDEGTGFTSFGMGKTSFARVQEQAFSDTISNVMGSLSKPKVNVARLISTTKSVPMISEVIVKAEKIKGRTMQSQINQELNKVSSMTIGALSVSEKSKQVVALQPMQKMDERTRTALINLNIQLAGQRQESMQRVVQVPSTSPTPMVNIIPVPVMSRTAIPFFPLISIKKKPVKRIGAEGGYNVYIKGRKISDVPLEREEAMNFGSWVSDNTLAAQFQLRETKQKPQKSRYNVPPENWMFTRAKFRDYEIRHGKQIPLKDRYIENAPFRLDTSGEVEKIQVARFLAQERKKETQSQKINQNLRKTIFGSLRF